MVGVKKYVVDKALVLQELGTLLRDYNCVKIALPGSLGHRRARLNKDQALLSAWGRRKEGKR